MARNQVKFLLPILVILSAISASSSQGCGYVTLTDPDGYIYSPNYPLEYDDYIDCRWLIQTVETNRVVVYFVGNFSTETGFDRLTFYDGDTVNAPVMLDWSGNQYFYPWITSKTNHMLIQFTSLRGYSGTGFQLRFYTEEKQTCGGVLNQSSGTIASPGFPANTDYYDNNVDCEWTIVAPGGQQVTLQFNNFTTEPGRDFVTVIDPALADPVVMTHSGRVVPPVTASRGNQLIVRFQSDAYMHDIPGFIAQYSVTGII